MYTAVHQITRGSSPPARAPQFVPLQVVERTIHIAYMRTSGRVARQQSEGASAGTHTYCTRASRARVPCRGRGHGSIHGSTLSTSHISEVLLIALQ